MSVRDKARGVGGGEGGEGTGGEGRREGIKKIRQQNFK